MLLGQSPFRGDDEDEIFDAILEDEPLYPIHMPKDSVSILQKVSLWCKFVDVLHTRADCVDSFSLVTHCVASALENLAGALLPLVMLAVGLSIQLRMPRDEIRPLAAGLVLKLLVMPAIALPLSLLFGMSGTMLQANVLESAMPSMITAAALAIAQGLAPRLAAALVGYGILLSLVTLPAWAWVLGRFA